MQNQKHTQAKINKLDEIFVTCDNGALSVVKMKAIQEMIQFG